MAPARLGPDRRETYIGVLILVALAGILAGVLIKQSRYNIAIVSAPLPDKNLPGAPSAASLAVNSDLRAYVSASFAPLGAPEAFAAETLSDKIDGKAELYLSAGFLNLVCQRFGKPKSTDSWMEIFVYDMVSFQNAFAVFSAQKRSQAQQLDFARFAYRTENALFFVHGSQYIEIVASSTSEELADEMLAFARKFIAARPVEEEQVSESSLFPAEGLQAGSFALLASDAFGFDRLDNIFTASYGNPDAPITAFLSLRANEQEAAGMLGAYHQFLLDNGGSDEGAASEIPGSHILKMFDTFEVIFSHGRAFAGVHEAENRETAERVALLLYRRLLEERR